MNLMMTINGEKHYTRYCINIKRCIGGQGEWISAHGFLFYSCLAHIYTYKYFNITHFENMYKENTHCPYINKEKHLLTFTC